MAKTLGIVSTTYHLLVLLFLKESVLFDDDVDLIVTNKTENMANLYKEGRFNEYFNRVYFADATKIKNPYKSGLVTFFESFVYNGTTQKMLDQKLDIYDKVFFAAPAMPDEMVKEIAKTLIRKNHKVTFHRFEDGFASYTKKPISIVNTSFGQKMYQRLFHYDILEMETELYLFEPFLIEESVSESHFQKIKIVKDPISINIVIGRAREIFQHINATFPEKYIFLGQGTKNSMQNPETYRSIIKSIAEQTGRDNFVIKPHPRGEYDQFDGLLKTYYDDSPFELALAGGHLEDKVFISFYSTACVSGNLLFNSNAKVIFIYPLAADSFNEKCDYENYFQKLTECYPNIYIAHTMKELISLIN